MNLLVVTLLKKKPRLKKIFYFLILLSISCGTKKDPVEPISKPIKFGLELNAMVTKIDTIKNYYVINIRDENNLFRIVSKKSSAKPFKGIRIQNGCSYFFRVKQLTNRKPDKNQNNTFPRPINYLDISSCLNFENTEICTESGFELATADNVLGLYVNSR